MIKPAFLARFAAAYPLAAGALLVPAVWWLWHNQTSVDVLRAQSTRRFEPVRASRWWNPLRHRLDGVESFGIPPFRDTTLGWVQASIVGSYTDVKAWLNAWLWNGGWAALITYVLSSSVLLIIAQSNNNPAADGPPGRFVYPISRTRRARVALATGFIAAVTFTLFAAPLTYLLFAIHPFPQFMAGDDGGFRIDMLGPILTYVIVFSPVVFWGRFPDAHGNRGLPVDGSRVLLFFRSFAVLMLYAVLVIFATLRHRKYAPLYPAALVWSAIISIAIATHTIQYFLLRRSFRRKDLI
jgi:hypothetical protein